MFAGSSATAQRHQAPQVSPQPRRCSDTDNDPNRCSVAVWSLESCHTDRSPATNDAGNQGKHRVTKRRAALSNPMFTLVTMLKVKKNKQYILTYSRLSSSAALCFSALLLYCLGAGKQSGDVTALLSGSQPVQEECRAQRWRTDSCRSASVRGFFWKLLSTIQWAVFSVATVGMFAISLVPYTYIEVESNGQLWPSLHRMFKAVDEYQLVNSYGLFRRMTGVGGRPEVVVEGSYDKLTWTGCSELLREVSGAAAGRCQVLLRGGVRCCCEGGCQALLRVVSGAAAGGARWCCGGVRHCCGMSGGDSGVFGTAAGCPVVLQGCLALQRVSPILQGDLQTFCEKPPTAPLGTPSSNSAACSNGIGKEIEFMYKPGNISAPPPIITPHQPRLDWQMWFAALGHHTQSPWFTSFVYRLLQGNKDVIRLVQNDESLYPFNSHPPLYIRAQLYKYWYTEVDQTGVTLIECDLMFACTCPKERPSIHSDWTTHYHRVQRYNFCHTFLSNFFSPRSHLQDKPTPRRSLDAPLPSALRFIRDLLRPYPAPILLYSILITLVVIYSLQGLFGRGNRPGVSKQRSHSKPPSDKKKPKESSKQGESGKDSAHNNKRREKS
ncbi:unnamed protein product [Ranitomeya imitator]|uniref:Lipase maturation factor 2 n=1 Tax=Ranitomeya imitator TaxID=111125 RepID=A0ABN9L1N1_9NEOB|nr:unnamed protein product [Ranitomeya imitator]